MSFEIVSNSGERLLLRTVDFLDPTGSPDAPRAFVDQQDRIYSASFDGGNVVFHDGTADFIGRWLLGSAATIIQSGKPLADGFIFTFMDHGPGPQRLHAVWTFPGSIEEMIAAWKRAGFSLSNADRHWNRNHAASIHLRSRGAFCTGADSSHVIIPVIQTKKYVVGDIHVGEFNPLTGCGIGFVLHHLENWLWKRPRKTNSTASTRRSEQTP